MKKRPEIKSFAAAELFLNGSVSRAVRGKRSTEIWRHRGWAKDAFLLWYHHTCLVQWRSDGAILINSGGFRTATVKRRINQFTPFHVFAKRGVWYVTYDGKTVPFEDGMVLKSIRLTLPHEFQTQIGISFS